MTHRRLSLLSSSLICCSLLVLVFFHSTCLAKEIEVTSEWTLLGENDTVPAGAHIRMDLSSGEKWAKLVDEEEEDETSKSASATIDADGAVYSSAISIPPDETENTAEVNAASPEKEQDPNYDFDMMHRTLSQLPPEEQERMGGLPQLPSSNGGKVSKADRELFEARMKEIWTQRQAELQMLQEELVADLPQVLKDRIRNLQSYLDDPASELSKLALDSDSVSDEEEVTDVLSVLKDLEYQLSDLDNARDFYTLGGWPLLVTLLSDSVHLVNQTESDELISKIQAIQAQAAWAIGTMVKNTGEFSPFATEEVVVKGQPETSLSLLLRYFGNAESDAPDALKQKAMYALGALLRANRAAQLSFVNNGGSDKLAQSLIQFYEGGLISSKVAKRMLALGDDIVSDVFLHPSSDAQVDEKVVAAFSTKAWCDAVMHVLLYESQSLEETVLRTTRTLAPRCKWDSELAREFIKSLQTTWSSEESMDPDHLQERLQLTESALAAIKKSSKEKI